MAETTAARRRPASSPYATAGRSAAKAPARPASPQNSARPASVGAAPAQAGSDSKKPTRKKSWPVLELALLVLLAKVGTGVFLLFSGHISTAELDLTPATGKAEAGSGYGVSAPPLAPAVSAVASVLSPAAAQAAVPAVAATLAPAALAPAAVSSALPAALPAAAVSLAPAASAGSMVSGAALVLAPLADGVGEAVKSGAPPPPPAAIPMPQGSEDLVNPKRLPSVGGSPAPAAAKTEPSGTTPSTAGGRVPGATVELQQREQELTRREAALQTRENALQSLEAELKDRLAAIDKAKGEIEAMTQRNEAILAEQKALREQQEKDDKALKDARIEHLVTAYKGMKPDQAGALVNSLDDDVAVAILSAMPGRYAGLILANVAPEKAARLTKAISEKRIDPNLLLEEANQQQ